MNSLKSIRLISVKLTKKYLLLLILVELTKLSSLVQLTKKYELLLISVELIKRY